MSTYRVVGESTHGSVVVPTGFSVHALGCVRSLGPKGIHTIVAADQKHTPAARSRYRGEVRHVPSPYEDLTAYKDALLSLAARRDVQTVIPNQEEDTYVLSKYSDEFERHVSVGWPSFESLKVVQDGYALAMAAAEAGVPVPKTQLLTDVDDWNRELIVKQRYAILTSEYVDFLAPSECEGGGQKPVYLPTNVEPDVDELIDAMLGQVPIVQECVTGEEYSFRALYEDGEAVATSLRRQVRGDTYAGGASVFRELTHDPRVEALGERLLDHLDWHGLATVQFMKDRETGEFKLLEINPRIWASVMLDIRGGADYPYNYWLMTAGESDRIESGYAVGTASHLAHGELDYLISVLRDDFPNVERPSFPTALAAVLASIYRHPNFDLVSIDDPVPFLWSVVNRLLSSR
ncbi:hypothetical protein C440_02188 [Haloferax mucosum ATCC BAA-1512]|uniref:ATP-grasp domain-containing protein n=1 Tax=Haloferax mucosum ATCC BAA-1512 TaxID=662479 RepID=M0IRE7_9EURY|nr:ATP-grasp domain-containing protein [Haloferax mucosum]ELZ98019.1 hypothetical protein C440_02188 [Haloferax mucosum ATCC BAA-1512]